jgi:uncharacterized repeat protein (TIGR02543 family)
VPFRIGSDFDWEAVAVGSEHNVAVKKDGSLWAWGDNYYSQLGNRETEFRCYPEGVAFPFTKDFTITVNPAALATCTVTFTGLDGGLAIIEEVEYGSVVEQPIDPKRPGYHFIGWFIGDALEWDFNNPVTEDMRLYAMWEEHDKKVTAITVLPTCTEDGELSIFCSICGELVERVREPRLGHDLITTTIPATCVEDGYIRIACTRCDYVDITAIPALGHDFSEDVARIPATCKDSGYVIKKCSRCEEMEQIVYPALGHDFSIEILRVPATCKDGYVVIKCSRCEETELTVLPATDEHEWDEGVITLPPTYTVKGIKTFTCTRCGETRTEDIPQLPPINNITELRINTAPTVSVKRGGTYKFNVVLNEGASAEGIVWSVSNPLYATVDDYGYVTILNKTGMVILTATDPVSELSNSIILRIT